MSAPTTLIRFSGVAFTDRDLDNGDELHITATNADGEIVANGFGTVAAVTHRPRRDNPDVIERIHTVKVT